MMFVEDQKNNMSDINLGLMPIPQERFRKEMTQNEENEREKKLYELQRSIVMLRRKQFLSFLIYNDSQVIHSIGIVRIVL